MQNAYWEAVLLKRKKYGIAQLALLVWIAVFSAAAMVFPGCPALRWLQPFSTAVPFVQLWIPEPRWIFALAVLIPFAGRILLARKKEAGRWVIFGVQWLTMALNTVVAALHLMNEAGFLGTAMTHIQILFGNGVHTMFGEIAGLWLVGLAYPVAVIVLTSRWIPRLPRDR